MTEFWERWVGSITPPVKRIQPHAKVHKRDGQRWIIYPDDINGTKVIVEMPENAPTKSCDRAATMIAHTVSAGSRRAV